MANQPEVAQYDAGVYQIEVTDPVQGGVGGLSNKAPLNLANRTAYLKAHLDAIEAGTFIPVTYAPINSPTFTGSVSGPTPPAGDNTTLYATTAFVQNLNSGIATVNVAGAANVTLSQAQYGEGIIQLTGALTGSINVIFPIWGKWIVANNTSGAFTVTCKTAAGAGIAVVQGRSRTIYADGTNINSQRTDFDSVSLTGTPTSTTPPSNDNSTRVATTAMVQAAALAVNAGSLITVLNVAGNTTYTMVVGEYNNGIIQLTGALTGSINVIFPANGRWIVSNGTTGNYVITCKSAAGTGVQVLQGRSSILYGDGANIRHEMDDFDSVSLTGAPTAPTVAGNSDSTTKIATTGFVQAVAATLAPLNSAALTGSPTAPTVPGTADNSTKIATTGFVQAIAATKAPLNSPVLTGSPTTTTPSTADNSTRIPTTAMVQSAIAPLATIASPTFTGTPRSVTPSTADNSTRIATTAMVQAIASALAPIASPALTGIPTAPTPAVGDDSTKIATTAFVALNSSFPKSFDSGNVACPGGGGSTSSFSHGLGTVPTLVQAWLYCLSSDAGYASGTYMQAPSPSWNYYGSNVHGTGVAVTATGTTVRANVGSDGISAIDGTSGAWVSLTPSKWQISLKAWA